MNAIERKEGGAFVVSRSRYTDYGAAMRSLSVESYFVSLSISLVYPLRSAKVRRD